MTPPLPKEPETPPVDQKVSNLSRWTGISVTELQAKSAEELEKIAPLVLDVVGGFGPISIELGITDLAEFKPTSTTAYVDGKAVELKQGTGNNRLLELPATSRGTELELAIPAGYYAVKDQHNGFKAKTLRLMSRAMLKYSGDYGGSNSIYMSITEVAEDVFAYIDKRPTAGLFSNTFSGCSSLTTIPADLFSGVNGSADRMFTYTFSGCTSLTSIPADLFSGVSGSAEEMLVATFYLCQSLTGPTPTIDGKKLWEALGTDNNVGAYCFAECPHLSDYAEIPAGWK